MIDTFQPLDLGEAGVAAEDPAYAWTWAGRHSGEVGIGEDGGPAVYSNS
jgi:homogentisate 1,2-dioxygenase